jgi:hypothetical protein
VASKTSWKTFSGFKDLTPEPNQDQAQKERLKRNWGEALTRPLPINRKAKAWCGN